MTTETRTVLVERSYLVRVTQTYRVTAPVDLIEDDDADFDQFVCDQGELLSDETACIDDDQLETVVRGDAPDKPAYAPGLYRLSRVLQNRDVSTRFAEHTTERLWMIGGIEGLLSTQYVEEIYPTIEAV